MLKRTLFLMMCIVALAAAGALGSFNPNRDPSLVGLWKLDETSGLTAEDSSGLGNHGTLSGIAADAWTEGIIGGALAFPGNDSWVDCGNDESIQLEGDLTVTAWAKMLPGNDGAYIGVVGKLATGNYAGYSIVRHSANVYRMWTGNGTTDLASSAVDSDEPVTDDEWHHVAGARRDGRSYLFVDGVQQTASREYAMVESGHYFHIGKQYYDYDDRYWNGVIDDVRLYNRSLTESEVARVMIGAAVELAEDPVPAEGEMDVPLDTTLSWSPGIYAQTHDVYLGTVFEDVNAATRANPMGVLVSQGQTGTSYDPGLLDYGTTYYWRVDEVNGAPDNTIFKGVIFSFNTELLAYPIEDIVATTNLTLQADQGPENVVNGSGLSDEGQHSTDTTQMWLGIAGGEEPMYIQFEFNRIYQMYAMDIWNHNFIFEMALGLGVKDATIEYSTDGTEWTVLGDIVVAQASGMPNYEANTTVDLEGVAAKYVRMIINSNYGGSPQFGLSEVVFSYVPAQTRFPDPIDGAQGVSVTTGLSWRNGRDAVSHTVSLGTDPDTVVDLGTTTGVSYNPGTLDLDTMYYWKVDADDGTSVWLGDLWSFTTQEYLQVEDFESYTDDIDAGQTIWQTWIDGLDDSSNGGGVVGYGQSPFAEQGTVRTGAQAMPFFFDNASASAISETDRTFDSAQNWSASAIKSLTVWFHGAPDNTGRLYVKINGTKVLYNGDASDIAKLQWQPWNIDLATTGAGLSNVATLSIGVEGVGSGVVYIDDIRLYAKTPQYITPAAPEAANLVANYALNGNANDSSGNGYNGTATGGYLYVDGVNGQGIDFDGASGFIGISNATDWPSEAEPRTMSAWLLTHSVADGYRFAVAYGTAATGQAMFLGINGTTLYGGGYGDDVAQTGFWIIDEWYHTALTYDGTVARLYANGVEIASDEKDWGLTLNRARIGQQINDLSEFWDGTVDDVYIYSSALSAEEIAYLGGRTAPIHVPF